MSIQDNQVVSFHYTLTDGDGKVLDTSDGREPLDYLQGHGNIIPGLEKEMTGKAIGDKFSAVITPEEGYGLREEGLVQSVQRSQFQDPDQIQLGAQFQVKAGEEQRIATITGIDEEIITVDMNHPLAGETLTFQVEILAVRDATQEELSHGHVHSGDHHHHSSS